MGHLGHSQTKPEADKMTDQIFDLYGKIAPGQIHLHMAGGRKVNPRGPIRDTTDLQQSISEKGIIKPLLVRQRGGRLYLIDGERRLTAAKILGLALVPYVVIDVPEGTDIVDLMFTTNLHEGFPDIVIDKSGTVVGGVAHAVAQRLAQGDTNVMTLARIMGKRPDLISAYDYLTKAPIEVRQAVAHGRLSMSAYARMKRADAQTQIEIVQAAVGKDGQPAEVTLDKVRQGLRQAKAGGSDLASLLAQAHAEAAEDDPEGQADLGQKIADLTTTLQALEADQIPPLAMVALQRLQRTIEKLALIMA